VPSDIDPRRRPSCAPPATESDSENKSFVAI
jgi:hypothetical protein